MSRYLVSEDYEGVFAGNAMILFPLIQNLTISHGRATEILGVHKTDLIEFYDSIGIPYLNQTKDELLRDAETLNDVLRKSI
jgi:propanediol dehydratase small subunit